VQSISKKKKKKNPGQSKKVKGSTNTKENSPFAFSFARSLTVMRYELCMS